MKIIPFNPEETDPVPSYTAILIMNYVMGVMILTMTIMREINESITNECYRISNI